MRKQPERRAFVAVELLAIILVVVALLAFVAAGAGESRRRARVAGSITNLQQIAAGTSSFAADNEDRFFSFSWRHGEHHQDPDGYTYPISITDNDAAAQQAVSIIRQRAHRPDITLITGWFPHLFYNYLALVDYLDRPLPLDFAVSPSDHTRLAWQRAARVPGDAGAAYFALINRPAGFSNPDKRWPFSGSYYFGPCFYSPDAMTNSPQGPIPTIAQSAQGHRFYEVGNTNTPLGRRRTSEVVQPANKAMAFEGYPDDTSGRRSFYFYDQVRTPVLFADGSASVRSMADANPGFQPNSPNSLQPSRFPYAPELAWEAPTLNGANSEFGTGRIQWTRSGLRGRDFGGPELGLPPP